MVQTYPSQCLQSVSLLNGSANIFQAQLKIQRYVSMSSKVCQENSKFVNENMPKTMAACVCTHTYAFTNYRILLQRSLFGQTHSSACSNRDFHNIPDSG